MPTHWTDLVLATSLVVTTGFVFIYPVHIVSSFDNLQSLADVQNPIAFAVVFYLMVGVSLLLTMRLANHASQYTIVPVVIYVFTFMFFWTYKSPVPLTTEAPYHMGLAQSILSTGRIEYSIGYLQYPLIYLLGGTMVGLTGAPLISIVVFIEAIRPVLFALAIYLVGVNLTNNRVIGSICAIMSVQFDVMLSRMPAFHPEVFGLLFFLYVAVLLVRKEKSRRTVAITSLLFIASSLSYSLSAIMIVFMLSGVLLWYARKRIHCGNVTVGLMVFLAVLTVSWSFFVATQIPNALSVASLGGLINPLHYYFLSRNASTNTVDLPIWVGGSTLAALLLLFGAPFVIAIQRLASRKPAMLDLLLIMLLLPSIALFTLPGGAEAERVLYYLAPFSSLVVLSRLSWKKGWGRLNYSLILGILLLSLPTFLGYNAQANANATFPQALIAGQFVYSHFGSTPGTVFLGSGIIGIPGEFFESHNLVSPDYSFFPTETAYNIAVHSMLASFVTTKGSIFTISPAFFLSTAHIYGSIFARTTINDLSGNLSTKSNLVYANGYTSVFE